MNTSLKKTLIEGVIVELAQFSVYLKKNKQYIYGLSSIAVWGCLRITKISDEYVIKKRLIVFGEGIR